VKGATKILRTVSFTVPSILSNTAQGPFHALFAAHKDFLIIWKDTDPGVAGIRTGATPENRASEHEMHRVVRREKQIVGGNALLPLRYRVAKHRLACRASAFRAVLPEITTRVLCAIVYDLY
jgi:hypothetical protein